MPKENPSKEGSPKEDLLVDHGPMENGQVENGPANTIPAGDMPPQLFFDRFLPYRAARLATALSRRLAERYEARFEISVAEWR
ncbi:MAG: hypothetical protein CMN39_00695, partial [SAR116 cluster bacterium]|nr:hypothetical protein [SAR116 cluster bacterium]